MDLSKTAKKNRDLVEDPLWRISRIIDTLDEIRTRAGAAIAVWPETQRTLQPALTKLDLIIEDLHALKEALSLLWQQGFDVKWKI